MVSSRWKFAQVVLAAWIPAVAGAGVLTYPGPAPCDTTLQACLTGALSGDTVEIATNVPIDENLTVGKSLTLRPAAGFTPTLGGGATVRSLNFSNLGSSGFAETLLIEQLHFDLMQVRGLVSQASGHSITIRDNRVTFEFANNNTPAVEIDARVPLTGVISGNRITSTAQAVQVWAITDPAQVIDYTIERNVIDTSLSSASYIGINTDLRGSGTYHVRIFSNVIDGVGGCFCGNNSGIAVDMIAGATADVSVNNNTVNRTQTTRAFNILVRDPGAVLTVNLFNNIASFSDQQGFHIDNFGGGTLTLNADQNVSFGNGEVDDFGGYDPGTVREENPLYRNEPAGDLTLLPFSSLINSGITAPTGGVSALDAAGAPRVLGSAIDVGAYEVEFRTALPQDIPTLSPLGLAALSTLLLLAAALLLNRRGRQALE